MQNVESVYPASPLQQGLLFHSLSAPGEPLYFEQVTATVEGRFDPEAFLGAWQRVVDRHPILRTAFSWDQVEEPLQVVGRRARLPSFLLDWTSLPEEDQRARWRSLLEEDRARGFDLSRAPLIRIGLVRLSPERHAFLWSHHHILLDGWSLSLVFTEVLQLYDALASGAPPPDLPAPPEYREYVRFVKGRAAAADRFWREQLGDLSTPTRLSIDRGAGAPGRSGCIEQTISCTIPEEDTRRLKQLSQEEGVTTSTLVHAAWARLLGAYCGEPEVVFGTTLSARPPELEGSERMVGLLINTVPLRVRLDPRVTVRAWLRALQAQMLLVQEHQHAPLSRIQAHSSVRKGTPLFESVFAFQNYPLEAGLWSRRSYSFTDLQWSGPTNYPLTVRGFPGDEIMLVISYHPDRIDHGQARALLHQFAGVLAELGRGPDRPLAEVAVVQGEERRRMVETWNATARDFPRHATLHGLFEENARARPDTLAVVAANGRLSHGELESRANRLARHLRRRGVRPGDRVAICTEKSVETVVGLVAIAKAGAAYVPIDPDYPAERAGFMLDDAQVSALLTQAHRLGSLPPPACPAILLDQEWPAISREPDARPEVRVPPEALAYVIYTSGSTGRPKGVMLDHRGRVNNFHDYNRLGGVGPEDRVLGVSSLSFDMSAYDVFGILAAGGAVVFPDPRRAKDPAHWAELIRSEQVTLWHSAPALLELLAEHLAGAQGPHGPLRLAIVGGDWIPVSQPDRVRTLFPGLRFLSAGGATELSMDSTIFEVGAVDPSWRSIPYGRPMDNQTAYVLDPSLQPCPLGVPGELHLGGVGLAAGYFRRPELTAEKFVPHPFPAAPGERLYRTGDLARWMPNGNLELLGRLDFQVKIRGLRIELGEIEAQLRAHPAVEECVVAARVRDGERYLVAYVVPAAAELPDLRAYLRGRIPEYMVPLSVVPLDRLPLTPNGKVDRRNLPEDAPAAPAAATAAAPRTAKEREIAAQWARVLGLPDGAVGIDTRFFDLGGDSLKAIRACRLPSGPVPIADLYEHPTIRDLAAHLEQGAARPVSLLSELVPREGELAVVCVPYGGGNASVYHPLAEALPPAVRLLSVRIPGHDLDGSAPELRSLEEVAELVVRDLRARAPGRLAVYGHCAGTMLALELVRQLEASGREVEAMLLGGVIPPDRADHPGLWSEPYGDKDDEALARFIISLGGFEELSPADLLHSGRLMRHDARLGVEYIRRWLGAGRTPLRTPLTCLVGDADPLTEGYQDGYRAWRQFSSEVTLEVVPGGGHYFIRHQAAEVAARIVASTGRRTLAAERVA